MANIDEAFRAALVDEVGRLFGGEKWTLTASDMGPNTVGLVLIHGQSVISQTIDTRDKLDTTLARKLALVLHDRTVHPETGSLTNPYNLEQLCPQQ